MAYLKHVWIDDEIIERAEMQNIEDGIDTAHDNIDNHIADATTHLTSAQNDGLDGANAPGSSNVFATILDIALAINDDTYDESTWNDNTDAASKNAIRDKIITIDSNIATHKTSDGSDHTFIDQDVTNGSSPTFDGVNITNIDADTLIADVKEANVSAVTKGQMCAIVGSSGNKFEVRLCDCDDANIIRALGLVVADTAQNATGQVVHKGLLTNVNTQIGNTDVNPNGETWAAGDMLFVSNTPGGLTNVRPSVGRCIKAGRTLKGNSASDALLAIVHTNDISACAAAGEDLCNRMGDNDGVNKCSFKDYANNEVAAFDSNGNLTLIGTVDGIDIAAVENRATAIENDIDYPTAVKTKAITDTGEDGGVEGGVFNGDFEYGSGSRSTTGWIGDEKYKWRLAIVNTAVTAEFDDTISHSGNQSLKVSTTNVTGRAYIFTGFKSTQERHIHIKPNALHRLSGWIKTNNVAVDSSFIRVAQFDANGVAGSTSITNKLTGTNDWTYVEKIFTSDADAFNVRIDGLLNVVGNISDTWFDDIKLEQIDTQAVNTQLDEIVSVSVEGVTTTDNIDQYLETSGNTYTLTTGIDEGATHRQTFIPTADRGDGKHILTKIQALVAAVGTGDWMVEVHDAANNVLAATTIVNGSMSTGDVDFDVPAILDVGTAYHFHIYSTVADGTVTTTDNADLETVDYHAQFAKHTESPMVEANGSKLDMTGVRLLTGATITVNADGSGKYKYIDNFPASSLQFPNDILESSHETFRTLAGTTVAWGLEGTNLVSTTEPAGVDKSFTYKIASVSILNSIQVSINALNSAAGASSLDIYTSLDNVIFTKIGSHTLTTSSIRYESHGVINNDVVYIKFVLVANTNAYGALDTLLITADLDCQAALPIFTPSTEVTTETSDLTLNPIDISEDGYWQLNSDLTGWGSRTFAMLASEAAFESQAVSANYIYMYDSNGTTPWTWDERSGLVPPADRTSGTVTAKFLVGDNQIKSSVNDGSMKANVNLSWNEESLRAAINRLTELANLQYPIVIEVEDVSAIDVQDQPTGADAETGYTNDVTSLRQTTAGVAAIAYTGLLPRENQFSEWLDITVVCSDGDGTLQGKLYTVDGTLVETYADLESNPVIEISNPDYKYSRERLILQISASVETTSTAWSVTNIKWRYQYNG